MKFLTQVGGRLGIYTQISFYTFDGFKYYCNNNKFSAPTIANLKTILFLNYIKRIK